MTNQTLEGIYPLSGFTDLPDFKKRYRLRMLLMGDSGSGKSGLAATAPGVIFADVEGQTEGSLSVRGVGGDAYRIRVFDDMDKLLTFLEGDEHIYQTIVVDSFTDLSSKASDASLDEAEKRNASRYGDQLDRDINTRAMVKMRRVLHRLVSLRMHLIIICAITEGQGGIIYPDLSPAVSRHTRQLMDACGFVRIADYAAPANPDADAQVMNEDDDKENRELRILFQPRGKVASVKDNTAALGGIMRSPTIPTILARIAHKALVKKVDDEKQLVKDIQEDYHV